MRNYCLGLLLIFAATLALQAPASAALVYYVVHGYDYPLHLMSGPYDDLATCTKVELAISANYADYTYRCVPLAAASPREPSSDQVISNSFAPTATYYVRYSYDFPAHYVSGPFSTFQS